MSINSIIEDMFFDDFKQAVISNNIEDAKEILDIYPINLIEDNNYFIKLAYENNNTEMVNFLYKFKTIQELLKNSIEDIVSKKYYQNDFVKRKY